MNSHLFNSFTLQTFIKDLAKTKLNVSIGYLELENWRLVKKKENIKEFLKEKKPLVLITKKIKSL